MNHRSVQRSAAVLLTVITAAAVSACGYQLAGSGALPADMSRTYLQTSEPGSEFLASLREALRLRGLEIVEDRTEASARIIISDDSTGQRVLSVSARNIPREYEIFYTVTFALESGGQTLIEGASLVVRRNYTFDETEVLAKSREERILRRALAEDLARQVVRRIEAAGSVGPSPVG